MVIFHSYVSLPEGDGGLMDVNGGTFENEPVCFHECLILVFM
jgi:hypothetical protein